MRSDRVDTEAQRDRFACHAPLNRSDDVAHHVSSTPAALTQHASRTGSISECVSDPCVKVQTFNPHCVTVEGDAAMDGVPESGAQARCRTALDLIQRIGNELRGMRGVV